MGIIRAVGWCDQFSPKGENEMSATAALGLKHILFATDFSPRSDRAGRRVLILAKQFEARLTLVHVVDDDQPNRLVKRAQAEASNLLNEMRQTIVEVDSIDCETSIALGEAFAGTLDVCAETDADMIAIGPHRRQILKDVFTGTTAERIIRNTVRPVLMVNAVPAGPYRHILVAVDMSECSAAAIHACIRFKFGEMAGITAAHIFDTPATGHMRRASLDDDEIADHISEEKQRANGKLKEFLRNQSFTTDNVVLRPAEAPTAVEILNIAEDCAADLIVIGTRGRTGLSKVLLGSVAEELLRIADRDVLTVPPQDN
jgi:nucleotide-binding universal stress UspA family protein